MIYIIFSLVSILLGCGITSPDSDSAGKAADESLLVGLDNAVIRSTDIQSSQVSSNDDRPTIVVFGDSLTEGYGLPSGKSFPDVMQRELDDQGYYYAVLNEGGSGDTTSGGLMRCSVVASHSPAIAIVALGGNDGLRGIAPDLIKKNLRSIIKEFSIQGTQVVIGGMKLPPNYGRQYTGAFERVFYDLARELDLPLIPFLLEGVGGYPEFMQDDGIHPNEKGTLRVASLVMRHLQPLLTK